MARITKKDLIEFITNTLKANPDKEVCIVKYQNELRNGRWGLHAYSICYRNETIYARPWSGAEVYWNARIERLKLAELQDIADKCKILVR